MQSIEYDLKHIATEKTTSPTRNKLQYFFAPLDDSTKNLEITF